MPTESIRSLKSVAISLVFRPPPIFSGVLFWNTDHRADSRFALLSWTSVLPMNIVTDWTAGITPSPMAEELSPSSAALAGVTVMTRPADRSFFSHS